MCKISIEELSEIIKEQVERFGIEISTKKSEEKQFHAGYKFPINTIKDIEDDTPYFRKLEYGKKRKR